MEIPEQFKWLEGIKGNCILEKALSHYGIEEADGEQNNDIIIQWAKATGKQWYDKDSLHWCGVFLSYVAKECGYDIPEQSNRSLSWIDWGDKVDIPQVGDILVYKKKGIAGHIGLFVAEEAEFYWTLGGNQLQDGKDSVNIKKLLKEKCVAIRRPPVKNPPANETSNNQESPAS